MGLSDAKAQRLALAVDELVTDVVCFAYPGAEYTFHITFRADASTAEVIIQEQGVPFELADGTYDRDRALEEGDFDRAGCAVLWALQDDGVDVTLYDPPALFREMVAELDLEDVFDVEVAAS